MDNENKILITGGSGFIGTHYISKYCSQYKELINLDISPPILSDQRKYWVDVDLLNYKKLQSLFFAFQPTHVLHLAARTDLDEKKSISGYSANIDGVYNLIRAIKSVSSVQRVVIASSMLVCEVGYVPKSENDYHPINLYARSKVETELIVKNNKINCIWTIIRPTTIWGPYHYRLQNGFFKILQSKMYFHPGNKKCFKSYGYVKNTVFQIHKILEARKRDVHKKTFYLADSPISLDEWVDEFSNKLVGFKAKSLPYAIMKGIAICGDLIEMLSRAHFPMNSFRLKNMTTDNVVDTYPIDALCGQLPYSLMDGVDDTCCWLQNIK